MSEFGEVLGVILERGVGHPKAPSAAWSWTAHGLAYEIGVYPDAIQSWRHGRSKPSREKFNRLCRFLAQGISSTEEIELLAMLVHAWHGDNDPSQVEADLQRLLGKYNLAMQGTAITRPSSPPDIMSAPAEAASDPMLDEFSSHIPRERSGRGLFRVPRKMWSEVAELAELRLILTDELSIAVRAAIERSMVGRGRKTDEFSVEPIGAQMRARLFGESRYFDIEPLGTEVQTLSERPVHWDWRVTPKREGRSILTLRISMVADAQGKQMEVDVQAFHQTIEVSVESWTTRPTRFIRDNWKWLAGSSGIGAVAAVYAFLFE